MLILAMGKTALWALFCVTGLWAQTAESTYFRAVLLPASEVPPLNVNAKGVADVLVSVVRDSSGQIVSGTVDMLARVNFAAAATVTGMDIWSGSSGQNGSVAISAGLSAANSRAVQSGGDVVHIPVQIQGDNASTLNALRTLYQNPAQFYINVLTTASPNGAIRGQLQKAQVAVLMTALSSSNELTVPPLPATGVAEVVAIATHDASGNWTSGEVYLSLTYSTQDLSAFTAFDIHPGLAGATGPVAAGATLQGAAPDPSGTGSIGPFYAEVTVTNQTQNSALTNLFVSPGSLYIDIHTSANPTGILRGQLRPTDSTPFALGMTSSNEIAPPSVTATAAATLTVHTLRNPDGSVAAGAVFADVDYRFPAPAQSIGLFLHNGPASQNGPIMLHVTQDFSCAAGFGNYYGWTAPITNGSVLAVLFGNPENYYADLHTVSDPAGAMRAQLGPPMTAAPNVAAVISADLDKNATTLAPGELISIFGSNLLKVPADLSGWTGTTLPSQLNEVSVHIAGEIAPLLYVSPTQINAQVPVDIPPGTQTVSVNNVNGVSAPYALTVAPAAPAIFFYPVAAILKNADYSLVSATNPAHAGDALLIFAAGLGQTNPPIASGALVPSGTLAQTAATVTVTIGGKPAPVVYSIASPGFAGLYQVAVTVPTGLSGAVSLTMQESNAISNTVTITVK
jgi:uncharacterized protein (TIGR03437 family)